ncbi:MAG: hypothetical protein JWP12_412 [Bacteroidetes bacterium]|nr:hypothetical protein [Bacteroidota bacterium]
MLCKFIFEFFSREDAKAGCLLCLFNRRERKGGAEIAKAICLLGVISRRGAEFAEAYSIKLLAEAQRSTQGKVQNLFGLCAFSAAFAVKFVHLH